MLAVVDVHVVEPGERAKLIPAVPEVGHRPLARGVWEDERAGARQGVEDGPRGRRELHRLRTGAVFQSGSSGRVPRIRFHLRPVISEDRAPVNSRSRIVAAAWVSSGRCVFAEENRESLILSADTLLK